MRTALVFAATALVVSAALTAKPQKESAGATQADRGRALYVDYCASCHGASGRGDGPASESFRMRPADLTQLAKQNGGVFVTDRIQRIVDGRSVKAHGSIEMPVWGDVFKRRHGLDSEGVKARIEAIVQYLRSIQERSS